MQQADLSSVVAEQGGSPMRKTNDHVEVKIPPWWNAFWAEHRSNAQYDEASAKVLLFSVRYSVLWRLVFISY